LIRRFRKALRGLARDNLLLAQLPRRWAGGSVSLDALEEQLRKPDLDREVLAFAGARCLFASGDTGVGERFEQALQDGLSPGAARDPLMASLGETAGDEVNPDLTAVAEMRGGLRDLERAALALGLTLREESDMPDQDAASVFRAAGERGLIAADAAERLAEAAALWRDLHGALRLIAGDGFAVDTASSRVKTGIARACGLDDFDALAARFLDTASLAAADIDALAH